MQNINNTDQQPYVSSGMPALDLGDRPTSFFEFWPSWIMYFPVFFQWLYLSVQARSFTVPLLANPELPLSGMVGIPKSLLLKESGEELLEVVLPWCLYRKSELSLDDQLPLLLSLLQDQGLSFPLVCKPDIGCRGAGVKKVRNTGELMSYLVGFPVGEDIFLQVLARSEAEAGIFYVREPGESEGRVVSLTLKYMPYIVGDGEHTLEQLVLMDSRAASKPELYRQRHRLLWKSVLPEGEKVCLVFSASHCRGALFRDGKELITPELTNKINTLMSELPEFHYGRLDVKFSDSESLKAGEQLEVIEINGASAELLHIWDSRTSLKQAIRALLWQYRTLFSLGESNRLRGYSPPGMVVLIKAWLKERAITRLYPTNE